MRGADVGLDVVRYLSVASRHWASLDVAGQRPRIRLYFGSIKYRHGEPGHEAEEW